MEPLNATPPAYQFLKIPPDLIWTRLSIWENFCLSNCTHSNVYYQQRVFLQISVCQSYIDVENE